MKAVFARIAKLLMITPSRRVCGAAIISGMSLQVPGSAWWAWTRGSWGLGFSGGRTPHFRRGGRRAPPRPRSPDSLTAVMMSSGAMASAVLSASYPPLRSYVASFQLCSSAQSEVRTGVKVSAILVTLLQLGLGLGARGVGLLGGLGGRGGRACGLAGRLGARRAPAVLAGDAQPHQ